jgi:hypothetical protein
MAVFWVVTPCSLVEVYQRFRGPSCLHHQGDEYVGKLLPDYTTLQPRRQPYSYSPPWEHQILLSIVLSNMYNVLFSYACILIGQVFICRYIFMVIYSFVPPFREATFRGVPSCVFEKSGCAAGEKKVAEHWSRRPASGTDWIGGSLNLRVSRAQWNFNTCLESNPCLYVRTQLPLLSYQSRFFLSVHLTHTK